MIEKTLGRSSSHLWLEVLNSVAGEHKWHCSLGGKDYTILPVKKKDGSLHLSAHFYANYQVVCSFRYIQLPYGTGCSAVQ